MTLPRQHNLSEVLPYPDQREFWEQVRKKGTVKLWYHNQIPLESVQKEAVYWLKALLEFGDRPLVENVRRLASIRLVGFGDRATADSQFTSVSIYLAKRKP